jgi:HSP20 family protein
MPFFRQPAAYFSPEATFLNLLTELDQPQAKSCAPRQARTQPQSFTPRFDVTEVAHAYELYGELPGLEQKDVTIEFSDAQTLVIKGKTERLASHPTAPQPEAEPETTSEKAHSATVEDEYDEADTPLATPATTATAAATETEKPREQTEPKPQFWVKERRVGEFARSFSFSQRIDQDGVKAALKNGILTVVVPKSQKSGKVAVNVL